MKHKIINISIPILLGFALIWGLNSIFTHSAIAKESFLNENSNILNNIQGSYQEAPMLSAMVAAGLLPPVEERLPIEDDIVVIDPVDGVGEYGGTWHNVSWWQGMGNIAMIIYDPPIRWKADYHGYEPGLLKSWNMSLDGKTLTWNFRQGIKWSDGEPFTSEDIQFWWEDLATNPDVDIVQIPWWGYNEDGSPMTVTFPNSMTVVMTWKEAHHIAPYIVAQGYWEWLPMERPKHFLSQYHPDYTPGATYEDLADVLFGQDWLANVENYPCLHAWCPETVIPGERTVWVRNPYYWKVDTAGNQLPYIDRIETFLETDSSIRLQSLTQGVYEASFRGTDDPNNIPILEANEVNGDYQVWPGAVNGAGAWPGWLVNQNFNDQATYPASWEAIGDLLRDKNFRQGLSYALDRDAMIQAVWDGNATAQQATISPQSWHFDSPQGQTVYHAWATSYVTYNTVQATALFTAANFIDQDSDGWRDLPDGTPFTLTLDMGNWSGVEISQKATEELETQLEAIGIRVAINDLFDSPDWDARQVEGLFMLRNCHVAELDIWTFPDWIFPVRDNRAWPLEGKWYQTGGSEGWEPQPGSPAYELQALYAQGLAEPDENTRHEIVWDAIDIHIQEGPFMIGVSGDQPMPVVIRNGFHGVPDQIILGPWAPGSPGNLHSEQFWMEESLRLPNTIYLPLVLNNYNPLVPQLELPQNGAVLDTLIPTFSWNMGPQPDGTIGCFALGTQPHPTGCYMSYPVHTPEREVVMWYNLQPDTVYYWRVGAVYDYDYDNKLWSEERSFTTGPTGGPILPAPILVSPANNSTVSSTDVTLTWQPVTGAIEYDVLFHAIDTDSWFSFGETADPQLIIYGFQGFVPYYGYNYEWTVTARNDYAWGDGSSFWKFTYSSSSTQSIPWQFDKDVTEIWQNGIVINEIR